MCVAEGEKDLYNAVKRVGTFSYVAILSLQWIYIHEENRIDPSAEDLQKYFTEKPPSYFYKYTPLLSHIRFQHIITSRRTLESLESENLIGRDLLTQFVNNVRVVCTTTTQSTQSTQNVHLKDEMLGNYIVSSNAVLNGLSNEQDLKTLQPNSLKSFISFSIVIVKTSQLAYLPCLLSGLCGFNGGGADNTYPI